MSTVKPHKQLKVWKDSIDFVAIVYEVTRAFPEEEKFGLVSQIRRSAVSIPANIAEGAARKNRKEFLQFPYIARGSLSEVDTHLELSKKLGYLGKEAYYSLNGSLTGISKMLSGLIKTVSSKE